MKYLRGPAKAGTSSVITRSASGFWKDVGASEKRKDAQLAREAEFAVPRETTKDLIAPALTAFIKGNNAGAA